MDKHQTQHQATTIPSIDKSLKLVSYYQQQIPQLQTNLWHREEELHKNHETPGRETKQGNQLSHLHQDDYKTTMDIK